MKSGDLVFGAVAFMVSAIVALGIAYGIGLRGYNGIMGALAIAVLVLLVGLGGVTSPRHHDHRRHAQEEMPAHDDAYEEEDPYGHEEDVYGHEHPEGEEEHY